MNVKVICVGKIKEPYVRKLIERCVKVLNRSCRLEIIELKDEKTPDGASEKEEDRIRKIEGERILKRIPAGSIVIPLCIDGKQMTSDELRHKWENGTGRGIRRLRLSSEDLWVSAVRSRGRGLLS